MDTVIKSVIKRRYIAETAVTIGLTRPTIYLTGELMNQVSYISSIPTSQTWLLFAYLDRYSNNILTCMLFP